MEVPAWFYNNFWTGLATGYLLGVLAGYAELWMERRRKSRVMERDS
jgi:hypothetical protein